MSGVLSEAGPAEKGSPSQRPEAGVFVMEHRQLRPPAVTSADQCSTDRRHDSGTVEQPLLSRVADDFGFRPAPPPADSLIGTEVGGVEILRLIGEGGMGRVYEGLSRESAERVAVKFVHPDAISAGSGRRLEREARVLSTLDHPLIARLRAAGTYRGPAGRELPFMVLEFIAAGRPITEWCRERHVNERTRIEMLLEICGAVAHAHERNVVHRDLKPGNVLVDASSRPRLVDFGVAAWSSPMATTLSTGLRVVGTPAYMSPEQREGGDVDERSDIYSLGVLAAELLADEPPVRAQVALAARRDPLARAIRQCLAIDPDQRYASVEDFATALRRCLNPSTAVPHRRRRLAVLAVCLAVEVMVMLALLVPGWFRAPVSAPIQGPVSGVPTSPPPWNPQ